jgi:predicted DNA-binding transcriptional regulator YafY
MSFVKARELLRIAEMAKARYRGVSLRDIMSELSVNERTARRMARELEDLCPKVLITEDQERRRYWKLAQAPFIDHRVVNDKELSALDLAIRRAARDGAEHEVLALQRIRDHLVASVPRMHARSAEVSSEIMLLANGFACRPGPAARVEKLHLENLFYSLLHPSMVEITYTSARNPEPRTKLVEPHGIIVGTRHYLVARDGPDDRQFKQYRFDRITKMSGTSILFQRDPDFDIETYSTFAFGSYWARALALLATRSACCARVHVPSDTGSDRHGRWRPARGIHGQSKRQISAMGSCAGASRHAQRLLRASSCSIRHRF